MAASKEQTPMIVKESPKVDLEKEITLEAKHVIPGRYAFSVLYLGHGFVAVDGA
jgi:hypothetical protein